MADQYDVTEGQCLEDCPDVEVATYCINGIQQVQNISRVNVHCQEDSPSCGDCEVLPGFDLPKTFCVADTQPAQNVMRVDVNKDADTLWEIGDGNTLQPKENKTFTIKKANEINVAGGSTDKFLNEQGDFTKPINGHSDLQNKNAETAYQHIDTTTTKQTLVEDDKVAIYDSVTGKAVLTDKTNVGYRITDIISTTGIWSSSKTNEEINKLLPLIYAGL